MIDYKHQCRYCAWCVFTINDTYWCDELDKDLHAVRRPNRCKHFLFNEIAADNLEKAYKPRKRSLFVQCKLFEIPTDRQRGIK